MTHLGKEIKLVHRRGRKEADLVQLLSSHIENLVEDKVIVGEGLKFN